jgi:hypothetical protein
MQHMPYSPDRKAFHKQEETEYATHALQFRQQGMPQKNERKHTLLVLVSTVVTQTSSCW